MSRGVKLDVIVRQGADFRLSFRPFDELPVVNIGPDGTSTTSNGTPSDLTGLTFHSQFRGKDTKGPVEATAVFETEDRDGQTWVTLHLPNAVTRAMNEPKGVYDVEAVDPDGEVIELLYGSYTLALEATRTEVTP